MKLIDYIKGWEKQPLEKLAVACGTTAGQLKQVAYGHRRANAALAIALDRETAGQVPCEETRPDIDWSYLRGTDPVGVAA